MADEKKLIFRLEAQNAQYLKKLEQSQKKMIDFEKTTDKSVKRVENDFARLNGKAANNVKKFGKASNDSFKAAKRGVGQLGFQLQDISVQLQGGQNPLLILSQQGSQVASIFGPSGAVLGAVIAIGSALSATFIPGLSEAAEKLFSVNNESKKLEKALEELDKRVSLNSDGVLEYTDRIKNLAKVSKAAAEVELNIAIIQAEVAISAATKGIVNSIQDIEDKFQDVESRSGGMRRGISKAMENIRSELGLTKEQAEEFREVSKTALEDPTVANIAAFNNLALGLDLNNDKLRKFIENLNTNLSSLNQNKEAVKELKDAIDEFSASTSDSFFDEDEDKTEKRIQKKIKAKLASAKKEEEAEKKRNQDLMSFTDQRLGILANGLDREKGLGKAAFIAQQALAIPQMIVATEAGAAQALTLGPFAGPIASAAIKALGYASIGVVAGQTIASFEGGGVTPAGARAGGMDGHGGKLAMLHPNEKVIDLQRGGSGANDPQWSVNVINNGSSQITQSIDDEKRMISIMVDQARKSSGPFQAAMRENTNLEPRARR